MREINKGLLRKVFLFGMIVLLNVCPYNVCHASIGFNSGAEEALNKQKALDKQKALNKQEVLDKQIPDGEPLRVVKKQGTYYAVDKDKAIYMPRKAGIRKIGKYTYYIRKNGELAQGPVKVDGKYYYFNEKARLQGSIRPIEIHDKYFNVNEKGVLKRISKKQAQAELAAQNFIKTHTKQSSSNSEKFRTCFYYMIGNMCYSPDYFRMREDYRIMDQKDGGYTLALQMFESPVLRGNCHRFAHCVAAVAKELGYQPTVIVTTADHSFVKIDGKYYDNMGALFGAESRDSYTLYKKFRYT